MAGRMRPQDPPRPHITKLSHETTVPPTTTYYPTRLRSFLPLHPADTQDLLRISTRMRRQNTTSPS